MLGLLNTGSGSTTQVPKRLANIAVEKTSITKLPNASNRLRRRGLNLLKPIVREKSLKFSFFGSFNPSGTVTNHNNAKNPKSIEKIMIISTKNGRFVIIGEIRDMMGIGKNNQIKYNANKTIVPAFTCSRKKPPVLNSAIFSMRSSS